MYTSNSPGAERTPYIKRGWQLSGMELAFEIAERANPRDSPEFTSANDLDKEGKLFEKLTGKRCSQAADAQLLQWHNEGTTLSCFSTWSASQIRQIPASRRRIPLNTPLNDRSNGCNHPVHAAGI